MENGGSRTEAALQVGVSPSTLRAEERRDRKFAIALSTAEARGKLKLIQTIVKAAENDWRAAAWMLERKYWREFAKRDAEHVTPDQLAAVIGRLVASIMTETPVECHARLRAKVEDILGGLQNGLVDGHTIDAESRSVEDSASTPIDDSAEGGGADERA